MVNGVSISNAINESFRKIRCKLYFIETFLNIFIADSEHLFKSRSWIVDIFFYKCIIVRKAANIHLFIVRSCSGKAEDYGNDGGNSEQYGRKIGKVYGRHDSWPVVGVTAFWCRIHEVENQSSYTEHLANQKTPKRTLNKESG